MMALIQQITVLLRITAAPNMVEEYHSNDTPVKIAKVMDMLEENSEVIVVIGVRHKNVVESYAEEIRARFLTVLFSSLLGLQLLLQSAVLCEKLCEQVAMVFCSVPSKVSHPVSTSSL